MVSALFKKDYRILTAEGVALSPDEVVRLNALALKVKLAAKPFLDTHRPRILFLPGFTLREPTVAHEIWLERVAEYFDMDDNRIFRFVYAFALSRVAAKLPDALRPNRVIRKVFAFAKKRLLPLTGETLADAIDFILYGADWTAGEFTPSPSLAHQKATAQTQASPSSPALSPSEPPSPVVGLIVGANARRLPLTLSDARRMTAGQLLAATLLADIRDGNYSADDEKHRALGNYVRAVEEIRNRKREWKPTR